MPSREPITLDILDKIREVVILDIIEYKKYHLRNSLCMLLVHLYEYFISYYTFYYSDCSKIATYKYVKENLPHTTGIYGLVLLRDSIVHNLPELLNYELLFINQLSKFSKENFNHLIVESLGEEFIWLYDDIIEHCINSGAMNLF